MKPDSPIILALDVPSQELALHWVRQLQGQITVFKVGMQLFYQYGPEIVHRIRDEGAEVFLDLKLHDIPNTVARACESLLPLQAKFLTVHISGGHAMLEAAQSVMQGTSTHLLGITALTSLNEETLKAVYPGMEHTPSEWALHLAVIAKATGLYGIVCSAQENTLIRQNLGTKLCLVNPGIRPAGTATQDQKRVMTPKAAIQSGGNYLVVGRPILQAEDPQGLVTSMLKDSGHAVGLSS